MLDLEQLEQHAAEASGGPSRLTLISVDPTIVLSLVKELREARRFRSVALAALRWGASDDSDVCKVELLEALEAEFGDIESMLKEAAGHEVSR